MVKKTLVAAIAVVLCAFLITSTISKSVATFADAKIEIAENAGSADTGSDGGLGLDEQAGLMDDTSMGGSTTDDTQTPADGSTGDTSTDSSAGEATTDTAGNAGSTAKPGDTAQNSGSAQPKDGIETLNYYNKVIAQAVNAKVGYDKERMTDNEKMDGSVALQAMKSLVYQFMGIGAENKYNEKVEKGKWGDVAFLTSSKLAASDVTSATCKAAGDNYVITLTLKDGKSSAGKSNPTTAPTTALDKTGICVGSEDKGYFDHKTASVIYDAIAGTYAGAEINEKYSKATVVATVNAKTGNLVSLVVEWNQEVTLSKLAGMSATASGISHVTYKNFKY